MGKTIDKKRVVRYNVRIEVNIVIVMNISTFRKKIFETLEKVIKSNLPTYVTTKDGSAVVISADDYNSMMETLYLCSIPGIREQIQEGMKIPLEDCVPEEEVSW